MGTVELAGRTVKRLGMSVSALRTTGMWGEPAGRQAAVAVIRRAVELGVEVLEVPVPFGPAGDLVREADVAGTFIVAHLTAGPHDPDMLRRRLGGRWPDLVLAPGGLLPRLSGWPMPLGVVVGAGATSPECDELAALLGPYPVDPSLLEWCETRAISYLARSIGVLAAGDLTVALPAPRSLKEAERLFGPARSTPPAGGPG